MTINPISEYPEVTELTENDYLPVETPTGLKRVKGSNVGGGGADDFVVNFIISAGSEMTVTGDHTAQEVLTAYNQGKNIKATGSVEIEGMAITFIFYLGNMAASTGVTLYTFGMEGGLMRIEGTAGSSEWDISTLN